uniref:Intermediate filament protein n=1 Tax=Kwoniella pini CBS 10737 TaxID=1296096 RepID=A0A1B9IDA5_9TREE|nr:uncharacterized protein I206_00904 [Kwoniella pini CBS 10737]OCF53599.1 hypothetical protein I206_00904 [Kwoniella pini CBS 10737]
MRFLITNKTTICTSMLILGISLLFPQLNVLKTLLLIPIYISSAICFLFLYVLYLGIQSDRYTSSKANQPAARTRYALRQLRFTTPAAWSAVLTRQTWEEKPPSFLPIRKNASHSFNSRVDSFLRLINLHFILPWYGRISPSPAFPHAVETLIRHFMTDVTRRAENVDWPDRMVMKVVPIISDHFQHYRSIEHLASTSSVPTPNPALPLPLPHNAHPALSSHLHTTSGIPSSIESHLRHRLARILEYALPEAAQSEVVLTIVREIVLGAVLLPIFDILCEPDFWNRQIDEKGGRYLHEQKQVDKFLSALSALPASSASATNTPLPSSKSWKSQNIHLSPSSTSVSSNSSSKQFDNFLKSIGKLKTLGEARRLRADVERELRNAKLALADEVRLGESDKDGDKRLRKAQKYVQRLDRAKVDIDLRVATLSGQPNKASDYPSMILEATSDDSVNLYSLLSDPSSLAYWLEYMDRRGRSRLVQYWLTVEGFKDPLEAAGLDSALDSASQAIHKSTLPSTDRNTIAEDVAFLYEMYFAVGQSEVKIGAKHRQVIEVTAHSNFTGLSVDDVRKVKHAVFASQREIYEQMVEDDWPAFKKTELYVKAVADVKRDKISSPISPGTSQLPHLLSPSLPSVPLPRTLAIRPPSTPIPAVKSRSLFDILSPASRIRQNDNRSSFLPANVSSPPATASISPPILGHTPTNGSQSSLLQTPRQVSPGKEESHTTSGDSSGLMTPPANARRSSNLDFLIAGGEDREDMKDRGKLFGDEEEYDNQADLAEAQRIEAIQAALNEIIASDEISSSRVIERDQAGDSYTELKSPSASLVLPQRSPKLEQKGFRLTSKSAEDLKVGRVVKATSSAPPSRLPSVAVPDIKILPKRRSIPNLSLSPQHSSKHLFDDDLNVEDHASLDEEDVNDANELIQLAAPGDLQLLVEISRLQGKITELVQQDHLLDTLIRQAELTGNQTELRILRRSQSSVRREQRSAIFQKAQFEQQEEENRLHPSRTHVAIPSSVVTTEDGDAGKQVVRYTIEISQIDEEGKTVLAWTVARRYNEFYELDKALKELAVETGGDAGLLEDLRTKVGEIPSKRLVPNTSASFVESRRAGLERYLQSLISSAAICDNHLLRSFLSRSHMPLQAGSSDAIASSTASFTSLAPHNIVKSLYKTMATSLDDALLGPSMLDMMYTTLSRQLNDFGGLVGLGGEELNDPIASTATPKEGRIGPMGGESGLTSFTSPICDLFIEVFDLKENNWLRRQAIVVILQQFLGSTIERKVRDSFRSATSSDSFEKIILNLEETLFPDGQRRPPSVLRTDQEKLETRIRASRKLGLLIPDIAANMIGRSNARRAARRVFGALQDTRLNQHLILSIMDEILDAMFPPRQ